MKILQIHEVDDWYTDHKIESKIIEGIQTDIPAVKDYPNSKKVKFLTQSQKPDFNIISNIISNVNGWNECLFVITLTGVFPSAEDWPKFYNWRGSHGCKYSLIHASGHLFEKEELNEMLELAKQVAENGWEAYLLFAANESNADTIVFIEHEEWVEVNSVNEIP